MDDCTFCKIIARRIPGAFVHEDETAVIFLDHNQAARGHLLIVPREHQERWHELDETTLAHLAALAARWGPTVLATMQADGYNLLQNNGAAANQEVMHVHLHLIPRWQGDRFFRGGIPHRQAERGELDATAAMLRATRKQVEQ